MLASTSTRKRHLGISRHKWEKNVKMNLKEIDAIRGIGLIRLWVGIIGEPF